MVDGLVYSFQNLVNNKYYVGITTDAGRYERFRAHYTATSGCRIFNAAMKKYGRDSFVVRILEDNIQNEEILQKLEQYWIAILGSHVSCHGYNITTGGEIGKTFQHTEEARAKIAAAGRGRTMSEEARAKISKAHTGKVLSEETKQLLREVNKGRVVSEEVKKHLSEVNPNKREIICIETCVVFASTREAARVIGGANSNYIHAIKNGTTCRGYHWQYKDDYDKGVLLPIFISKKTNEDKRVTVRCMETGEIFISLKEASDNVNKANVPNIIRAIKTNKTCGGYHWEYVE